MSSTGPPATAAGDTFVIHMDRESLGDFDLGKYDVTVVILTFEQDREISWIIDGMVKLGTCMDTGSNRSMAARWSPRSTTGPNIPDEWKARDIFPVISELAVKATLGILDRTVQRKLRA